jgi:hypothetical protein
MWRRLLGITLEDLDRLTEAIGSALESRVMTREELVREVGRLTGSAAFSAKLALNGWGTILKPAAFTGRLCFGPSLGQRVRFTRPDTWLAAEAPRLEPQAAAAARHAPVPGSVRSGHVPRFREMVGRRRFHGSRMDRSAW